jgi:hypothetical protein
MISNVTLVTSAGPATLDSQFMPSVTYCARRNTARWAQITDETRWTRFSTGRSGAEHFAGLAISRTQTGAEEQVATWARLLGLDGEEATSTAVTLPWLWAGPSSCVATVTVTQRGALTAIQVYQDAYNTEYVWPEHVGSDGLRTFMLDVLNQFDPTCDYSGLPSHIVSSLENCIRFRMSALLAEVGDSAIGGAGPEQNDESDRLQSIWRLRTALRKVVAGLHEQQPESTTALGVLTDAVSEIDTLLGVMNTQQLLIQTIADSRARIVQQRRDNEKSKKDKVQADREARHDRTLALFATVFVGPSLVFAFFSMPSSPKWAAHWLLLSALGSVVVVWLTVRLAAPMLRNSITRAAEGEYSGDV